MSTPQNGALAGMVEADRRANNARQQATFIALAFDPTWFGRIPLRVVKLGLIQSPLGRNKIVSESMRDDVRITTIFKCCGPSSRLDPLWQGRVIVCPIFRSWLPRCMA